jgi:hypothetical protein
MEIAWLLSITEDTGKAHVRTIFSKINVAYSIRAVAVGPGPAWSIFKNLSYPLGPAFSPKPVLIFDARA